MNYKQLKAQLKATEKSNDYLKECNKETWKMVIRFKKKLAKVEQRNKLLEETNEEKQDLLMRGLAMNTNRGEQLDFLINILEEIEEKTTDNFTKEIVRNAMEKHRLNNLIYNRNLADE